MLNLSLDANSNCNNAKEEPVVINGISDDVKIEDPSDFYVVAEVDNGCNKLFCVLSRTADSSDALPSSSTNLTSTQSEDGDACQAAVSETRSKEIRQPVECDYDANSSHQPICTEVEQPCNASKQPRPLGTKVDSTKPSPNMKKTASPVKDTQQDETDSSATVDCLSECGLLPIKRSTLITPTTTSVSFCFSWANRETVVSGSYSLTGKDLSSLIHANAVTDAVSIQSHDMYDRLPS